MKCILDKKFFANIQSPPLTSLEYKACKYEPGKVQGILKSNEVNH